MRRAGLVVSRTLDAVSQAAVVGISTGELDRIAAETILESGSTSSFLGYEGFPATICVSVNDEVIHGIPGTRVLKDGDMVSVDCGAIVEGWHADSAVTILVGTAAAENVALSEATHRAMWAGIAAVATSERISEVSGAIEKAIESASGGVDYGIVEDYVGHGIGSRMHQPPDVPNFRTRERGARIRPGLCIAIEPMVTLGKPFTQLLEDDWTVVTDDGLPAAHWEHTVAVLADGISVLTARDAGVAQLAQFGIVPVNLD